MYCFVSYTTGPNNYGPLYYYSYSPAVVSACAGYTYLYRSRKHVLLYRPGYTGLTRQHELGRARSGIHLSLKGLLLVSLVDYLSGVISFYLQSKCAILLKAVI